MAKVNTANFVTGERGASFRQRMPELPPMALGQRLGAIPDASGAFNKLNKATRDYFRKRNEDQPDSDTLSAEQAEQLSNRMMLDEAGPVADYNAIQDPVYGDALGVSGEMSNADVDALTRQLLEEEQMRALGAAPYAMQFGAKTPGGGFGGQ